MYRIFLFILFTLYCVYILPETRHYVDVYSHLLYLLIPSAINIETSYDYIIIGGGSSGAVVAGRLSENPNITVLVIEAGPFDSKWLKPSMKIPGACVHASGEYSCIDWKYKTKSNGKSMKSMQNLMPRGKVLGGSSSTNWMQYVRGNRADYDSFEKLGNKGWGYSDVLPFFKKLETFHHGNRSIDKMYRGTDGPIQVRYPFKISETTLAFVEAGVENGYSKNPDYNGESQEGFSVSQQNIDESGTRSSSTEYLVPHLSRKNLAVSVLSQATKIHFRDNVAIGVDVLRDGKTIHIKAKKEIILSSGAIGSPHLLMVSGVGPKAHLESLGIQVVQDLPVGANLQDHPIVNLEYNTSFHGLRQDELETVPYIMRYYMGHHNYLTGSPVQGIAFLNTDNFHPYPDLQLHFLPSQMSCRTHIRLFGIKPEFCEESKENVDALGFIVVLLHEKSVGSVRLLSKDPLVDPEIDLNFLDHPYDKQTLMKGIRIAQKIAGSTVFDKYRKSLKLQPANPHKPDSDEYWNYQIEHFATHLFHPVGTCKMGIEKDSVVDPELRVKGIKGLRVVDLSILPHQVSGNTHSVALMIGEKAADMILKYH